MATVQCKQLANQETHTGRWGTLKFNAEGQCEVSDEVGQQIADAGLRGYQVFGLPTATTPEDLDNEELSDEDMTAATTGASADSEDEPKKETKLGKKKK